MKIFGKNIVEVIFYVDYYRNLFLVIVVLKLRLIFVELYEEKVIWLLWMLIGFYDILILYWFVFLVMFV